MTVNKKLSGNRVTGRKSSAPKKPLSDKYLKYQAWIKAGRPGGIFKG